MSGRPAAIPPRARAYWHVLRARLPLQAAAPPLPSAAHVVYTWRCNLRCRDCDAWQREGRRELDLQQWQRVLDQLRCLDIVKVIGGEPFAREDLAGFVRAIRERINPFVVQLVTNATLTDRVVALVEELAWPRLHLRVSLDGMAEVHDRSRGVPGTFAKVMQTLDALVAVRRRRPFQLGVNFTLTDESYPDMDPLVELCRGKGVDLIPGFKVKPFLHNADLHQELVTTVGVEDPGRVLPGLVRPDRGARGGFNALEQSLLRWVNRVVFRKHAAGGAALRFRCRELRNLVYLNPYGDVVTCGLKQRPVGNVLREGFAEVWRSAYAGERREEVDACPGCMQGAVEIMSRLYGG